MDSENGYEEQLADYEKELASYLQERIKPGLSSSAIPLLARSIAKDIVAREPPDGGEVEEGGGDQAPDLEADMRELQATLGDDWILRFSVHGEDRWLSAEKQDSSQRVEAATATQLVRIAEAIDDQGDDGGAA